MLYTDTITGTTIGLKNDSKNIVAINLLGSLDIVYLLEEIAKDNPSLDQEIKALNKKLSQKNFSICYRSFIGSDVFFANNKLEENTKC